MPNHPEANVLGNSGKTYGTDKKRKTRTVQATCFQDFPWLSYCVAGTVLFCHYCRTAEIQQLLTFSKNAETAFTVDGFQNWKKAISRFQQHEGSATHKEALSKLSVVKQMPVTAQLVGQEASNQESRRLMLLKQLTSLRLLLRQGLAVRGHELARALAIVRLVLPDHVCGTLCRSASVSLTSPLDSSDWH